MIAIYIVQANRAEQPKLSVADTDKGTFGQWPLSLSDLARLNAETGAIINTVMGGVDWKHAAQEIVAAWSKSVKEPSRCQCSDPDMCLGCRGEVS